MSTVKTMISADWPALICMVVIVVLALAFAG